MIAAAVVPHPPLLVPDLAGGAAADAAELLAACDAAVANLIAAGPAVLVCVGGGRDTRRHPADATGSLGGHGVDLRIPAGATGLPTLPLSLTIGRWLLQRSGWSGRTLWHEVGIAAGVEDCERLGDVLAAEAGPAAGWLVLGDGCRRDDPTGDSTAAEDFDAAALRALGAADPAALLALDPARAEGLGATGRAAWQVLAGAVGATGPPRGRVRLAAAPFGVGYLVVEWSVSPSP